jgi:KDO2-lipid IV(A) lauroyltransferase
VRNLALYGALRVTAAVMPFLPLRVLYALATAAGTIAFYAVPAARAGILANLAVALPDVPPRKRARIGRCALCSDAKNWADTLRISRLSDREIMETIRIEGWDRVVAATGKRKGVVLVTMHLGNFDLVGQFVAAQGYRMTIPVEQMRPERLFRYLAGLRASRGINIVPLEKGPLQVMRALRRGEIVGLAGDRDFSGGGIEADFFGRAAVLPGGPARLARHTSAPLLIGIGVRRDSGGYQGYVTEAISIQRSDDEAADDRQNTERIARALEPFVRRFPEQWLAFSPIWRDRTADNDLATIERQEQAAV